MTSRRLTLWRTAAAVLWIASLLCFLRAFSLGFSAEKWINNPHLTDADRIAIHHLSAIADRWAAFGWLIQFTTAIAACAGLTSSRMVRRIFQSLGILIAADGITLLLMAIIIR